MSSPYVGEIRMFGGNFVPLNWLPCDGSLQQISQYQVLYTLIGNTYGGDGINTFAVPDLRGRTPINQGQGAGLSPRTLGQALGTETVTLTANQAGHGHALQASTTVAVASPLQQPSGSLLAGTADNLYSATPTTLVGLHPSSVTSVGGSQPLPNMMPSLCTLFILCANGIYPSR